MLPAVGERDPLHNKITKDTKSELTLCIRASAPSGQGQPIRALQYVNAGRLRDRGPDDLAPPGPFTKESSRTRLASGDTYQIAWVENL
jgi:hypothetical protein